MSAQYFVVQFTPAFCVPMRALQSILLSLREVYNTEEVRATTRDCCRSRLKFQPARCTLILLNPQISGWFNRNNIISYDTIVKSLNSYNS